MCVYVEGKGNSDVEEVTFRCDLQPTDRPRVLSVIDVEEILGGDAAAPGTRCTQRYRLRAPSILRTRDGHLVFGRVPTYSNVIPTDFRPS